MKVKEKACAAVLAACVALCLAPALFAARSESAALPLLTPGRLVENAVDLDSDKKEVRYRFKVDEHMYAVRLRMQDSHADLDMAVYDENGESVYSSRTSAFNETLFLYRMDSPALEDGTYTVAVSYDLDYAPQVRGERLKTIPFGLDFQVFTNDRFTALEPGKTLTDTLDPGTGMYQIYRTQVPSGAQNLRVDVFDSQADIDLFADVGKPFADPRIAGYAAQSYRSREFLVLPLDGRERDAFRAGGTGPAAKAQAARSGQKTTEGAYVFIMVMAEPDDVPATFKIRVESGAEAAPELKTLPDLSDLKNKTGLERALAATVEVLGEDGGGSGTVVDPGGWILTNFHVVRGEDGKPMDELSIGFSQDSSRVADSQFRAQVVHFDATRDIALLHITSGIYGQSLPVGYTFPFADRASAKALKIGDVVNCIGYPDMGGLGSRVTITLTRGIVAGFQDRGFGRIVKTDAEINSGNSGGAALDANWRLIGIPTMVVGSDTSQLAYVYPLELFPDEWFAEAGIKK